MKVDGVKAHNSQKARPQSSKRARTDEDQKGRKKARIEEELQLALQDEQTLAQQDFAARSEKTQQTKASELPNLSQEDLAKAVQQNDPDAMFIAAVISMKGKTGDINAIGKLLKQALTLYKQGVAQGDPHAEKMSKQVGKMLQAITKPQPPLALQGVSADGSLPMPQMAPQMQQALMAHLAQQNGMPNNNAMHARMGMHVPHDMSGSISVY